MWNQTTKMMISWKNCFYKKRRRKRKKSKNIRKSYSKTKVRIMIKITQMLRKVRKLIIIIRKKTK